MMRIHTQSTDLINSKLHNDAAAGNPDPQFLLSQECFRAGDLEQMIHWLGLASQAALPVAQEAMGYCLETGRGIEKYFSAALTHYDFAIQHGAYRAAYRSAELLFKSNASHDHD